MPAKSNLPETQRNHKQSIKEYVNSNEGKIVAALPVHMKEKIDHYIMSALLVISRDKNLQQCSQQSILESIINAAELGLDFIPAKGHAYLVPYKGKAQFMPGYRGFIDLARRSGLVTRIESHIVYENDVFDLQYGLNPKLVHIPEIRNDPGKSIGAYAIAFFDNSKDAQYEYMTKSQIQEVQKSSQTDVVWKKWPDEMWRKSAVRRLAKYLPISPDLEKALEYDNAITGIGGTHISKPGTGENTERLHTIMHNNLNHEPKDENISDAEYEDQPQEETESEITENNVGESPDNTPEPPDELTDQLGF